MGDLQLWTGWAYFELRGGGLIIHIGLILRTIRYKLSPYSKLTPLFRADVRKIAHRLIVRTIRYAQSLSAHHNKQRIQNHGCCEDHWNEPPCRVKILLSCKLAVGQERNQYIKPQPQLIIPRVTTHTELISESIQKSTRLRYLSRLVCSCSIALLPGFTGKGWSLRTRVLTQLLSPSESGQDGGDMALPIYPGTYSGSMYHSCTPKAHLMISGRQQYSTLKHGQCLVCGLLALTVATNW